MNRPRLTLRTRLTLVYGGLFLLAGLVLLALTYWLVSQQLPQMGFTFPNDDLGGGTADEIYVETITTGVWDEALSAVLTQGSIALAAVTAVAIGLGWVVAGRMLRPLQRVTETAGRIAASPAADRGLHERIAIGGPRDEIRELSETFNRMLERLDHSFDGQRSFVANASHELRTPLTLTRALLEVALRREGASPEVRQLGETLLEINARHERLIDGLLLLTRSDRELAERSYVDLADVADYVVAVTRAENVAVTAPTGEAATSGDPVLLERLVQNLLENAVRYNLAEDGWARVATRTGEDGSAVLEVSNSGPLVPVFEVEGLFAPFRRLGGERLSTAKGAGLGLSIVRAVARAHGGDVAAVPRPEGGLTVTVVLPPPGA